MTLLNSTILTVWTLKVFGSSVCTKMFSEIVFLISTVIAVRALELLNTLVYFLNMCSEDVSSTKHFITLFAFVPFTPVG